MASKKAAKAVNKKKVVIIIFSLIMVVVLLFAATSVAYAYTDGFRTTKNVAVYYDGKIFTESGGNVSLPQEGEAMFEIGGAGFDTDDKNFKISITPNPGIDFEFICDGRSRKFSQLGSLTSVFDITYSKNSFTISCTAGKYEPRSVISRKLGAQSDVGEMSDSIYYYSLAIAVNGGEPLTLNLRQVQRIPVDKLIPDNGEIIW